MRRVWPCFPQGRFQKGAKARLTDDELIAEVRKHWEHWAEHLGLQNWWVHFKPVKANNKFNLEFHPNTTGYLRCKILVASNPPEQWYGISKDVLHEVLHLFNQGQDAFVKFNMLPGAYHEYVSYMEMNADDLASIIYRLHEQTQCGKMGQNGNRNEDIYELTELGRSRLASQRVGDEHAE